MSIPDETQRISESEWRMWACIGRNGDFANPGHRRYTQSYCLPGEDIHAVRVIEDPEDNAVGDGLTLTVLSLR